MMDCKYFASENIFPQVEIKYMQRYTARYLLTITALYNLVSPVSCGVRELETSTVAEGGSDIYPGYLLQVRSK